MAYKSWLPRMVSGLATRSQILTVRSALAVARWRPSLENDNDQTRVACPGNRRRTLPLALSISSTAPFLVATA